MGYPPSRSWKYFLRPLAAIAGPAVRVGGVPRERTVEIGLGTDGARQPFPTFFLDKAHILRKRSRPTHSAAVLKDDVTTVSLDSSHGLSARFSTDV